MKKKTSETINNEMMRVLWLSKYSMSNKSVDPYEVRRPRGFVLTFVMLRTRELGNLLMILEMSKMNLFAIISVINA